MAFVWLFAAGQGPVTTITIDSHLLRPKVQRFGINLSDQTYYDGGQLARNLVLRNPGFEGGLYNSIIRCTSGTATTCMDDNANSTWPEGFWNGSRFEVFHGVARGRTGLVRSYTRADGTRGGVLAFARSGIAPSPGDYLIVRTTRPGGATAGWWPTTTGNASIAANRVDLPPGSVGAQTVALRAPAVTDSATLAAYFDRHASRSFVLLHGEFRLSFRAKGTSGTSAVAVTLQRLGLTTYLDQIVPLTERWEHYTFTFSAAERGSSLDAVALKFSTVGQDAFLLDDVELVQTDSAFSNRTVFRDPVVQTLQSLRPGVLRLWAGQLGDTLDNLIAEPFARQRSGYLAWEDEHEDISYGLHEFLELCAVVGADPWFVVPATFSTTDASNLIDYLAGDASSVYGAKRAARGHPAPWTSAFSRIHLEFGNEAWNATFKGGTIEYPEAYGQRARVVFAAMRRSTSYSPAAFDLVLGGQAVSPDRNRVIQDNCDNNDSFAVAPYMMNAVDAFADQESLYGSTFAEPEAFVSTHGSAEGVTGGLVTLNQQAIRASSHPVPLTVYEINLSTLSGTITQTALDSYVSSLGAGLAVVDAMLHNMRHGVATQNLWNLSQYNYTREDKRTVNLWGAVVDMGATNRRRPQFLALQLANDAIGAGSNMLRTVHQGEDPTWDQPMVNSVRLAGAHYLQSFAFSNGATSSVIVFNLHRTAALRVNFGGSHAPSGTVITQQLSAPSPGDTNESAEKVRIVRRVIEDYGGDTVRLPAHSMTSFTWTPGTTR